MFKKITSMFLILFLCHAFCPACISAEQAPAFIKALLDQIESGGSPSKDLKDKAGAYWQKQLIIEKDPVKRLDIFNKLAAIKYEQALQQMAETLSSDTRKDFWKPVFVFGKMGDKCIFYLLTKLTDTNRNVRINTIMLLGRWLLSQEAAKPFQEQYFKESDPEIRILLIKGLEHCSINLDDVVAFAKKAAAVEKNADVKRAAEETAQSAKKLKKSVKEFSSHKISDRKLFDAEYDNLYKSAARQGNVSSISKSSLLSDEQRLKLLRERILLMNSLECLDDYDSISRIIMLNRWGSAKP